jgi:ribosomal protein S18 acetylase RimI-like enzyme
VTSVEQLEHADPAVAAKVRDVQRAAYRVEAQLIGYDQIPPLSEEVVDIVQLDLTILGVTEGSQLVGLLGYKRCDDDVEIDRLAVVPTQFRRGIARALLDSLHAREATARTLRVSTGAANHPAVALYEAMGYRLSCEEWSSGVRLARFERAQEP